MQISCKQNSIRLS